MADGFAESKKTEKTEKTANAGVQAAAAALLAAGVIGAVWGVEVFLDEGDTEPAACSTSHDALPSQYVSGARLCAALNRPDLPALLGTPSEQAETASGNGDWITLASGTKVAAPEANVVLKTYSVKLSASYDRLPVTQAAALLGAGAQKKTVLGHPAVLCSDRTIALTLGGGKAGTAPGSIARRLLVARNAKDGGGSFEVVIWRQDDVPPDDAALLRVAERVLPTVPGWTAG